MSGGLQVARNMFKTRVVLGGIVAGLSALGSWIGGYRLGSVCSSSRCSSSARSTGTVRASFSPHLARASSTLSEAPVLHTTAEKLALAAGVTRPKLHLMDDARPRAFSVAAAARVDLSIALSRGWSPGSSGRARGHLAHSRPRSPPRRHAADAGRAARGLADRGQPRRRLAAAGPAVRVAPVAASLVHVTRFAEARADRRPEAARICASPHPLADASFGSAGDGAVGFRGASPATEPLYLLSPFGRIASPRCSRTSPRDRGARSSPPARLDLRLARAPAGCVRVAVGTLPIGHVIDPRQVTRRS